MTAHKYHQMPVTTIREGVERRLARTEHLMIVVVDFRDGPQPQPEPTHTHPHEQVTYVAVGKILFFLDGQPTHLGPGDVIAISPGKAHTIQLLSKHVRLIDCFTPIREDFLA